MKRLKGEIIKGDFVLTDDGIGSGFVGWVGLESVEVFNECEVC